MTESTAAPTQNRSVMASLRAVTPHREVSFDEALKVAELQAAKLADLVVNENGICDRDIAGLPRITVTYEDLAVSGMSHWNGQTWVISIARSDSRARQRFTLLHEFKHIIDHGHTARLYRGDRIRSAAQQAETAADYFAGCALVGKRPLKSAWGNGIQRVLDLATHFGVSEHAIRVRLAQTGLDVVADRLPAPRCARPVSTARHQPQRFRTVQPAYVPRSYS